MCWNSTLCPAVPRFDKLKLNLALDVANLPRVGKPQQHQKLSHWGDRQKCQVHRPFFRSSLCSEDLGSPGLKKEDCDTNVLNKCKIKNNYSHSPKFLFVRLIEVEWQPGQGILSLSATLRWTSVSPVQQLLPSPQLRGKHQSGNFCPCRITSCQLSSAGAPSPWCNRRKQRTSWNDAWTPYALLVSG